MENGISNKTELEASEPGVGLEVQSCHGVTIVTYPIWITCFSYSSIYTYIFYSMKITLDF